MHDRSPAQKPLPDTGERSGHDRTFFALFLLESAALLLPALGTQWGADRTLLTAFIAMLGPAALFLFFRKDQSAFVPSDRQKMTLPGMLRVLGLVLLCQALAGGITALLGRADLNTALPSLAYGEGGSPLPLLYSCLIAPISEEILYRDFLLGRLRPAGRKTAILLSAAFFALSHLNLPQLTAGFVTGLLLGWVSSRYGLLFSILAHLFNNLLPVLLPFGGTAAHLLCALPGTAALLFSLPGIKKALRVCREDKGTGPRILPACPMLWAAFLLLASLTLMNALK